MRHMPLSAELGNQIRTLTVSEINSSNREVHHPYRADEDSCNLLGLSCTSPSAPATSPSAPNSTSGRTILWEQPISRFVQPSVSSS